MLLSRSFLEYRISISNSINIYNIIIIIKLNFKTICDFDMKHRIITMIKSKSLSFIKLNYL